MSARHALVTGASQGLGAHVAARLVDDGWHVTGVARRAATEVSAADRIHYVQADLSVAETLETLPGQIGDALDLIVHSAVSYPHHDLGAMTLHELQDVLLVNALMPYRLTLDLLAAQPRERFCSCIVVNSEAIYHADARSGVYAASKAALRVLTTALAESCRAGNASVATLLLGPLANAEKVEQLRGLAARRGVTEEDVTRLFLRKSNPDLVIDELIDFESCYESVRYIAGLGRVANGMVCRLDGGSAGSLV